MTKLFPLSGFSGEDDRHPPGLKTRLIRGWMNHYVLCALKIKKEGIHRGQELMKTQEINPISKILHILVQYFYISI